MQRAFVRSPAAYPPSPTRHEAIDTAVALRYLGRHCPDNEWPVKVMIVVTTPMGWTGGASVEYFQDFGCRRARGSVVSSAVSGVGCGRWRLNRLHANAPYLPAHLNVLAGPLILAERDAEY